MSRKFAQLEVGFYEDRRLRSLSSDSARHAYTICLANRVGSYVGLHEYKLRMFANDLDVDVEIDSPASFEDQKRLVDAAQMGCFIEGTMRQGGKLTHRIKDDSGVWVEM